MILGHKIKKIKLTFIKKMYIRSIEMRKMFGLIEKRWNKVKSRMLYSRFNDEIYKIDRNGDRILWKNTKLLQY